MLAKVWPSCIVAELYIKVKDKYDRMLCHNATCGKQIFCKKSIGEQTEKLVSS